jgi:hypothetical protein
LTWSGITAQWDAVPNAIGYSVQLYKGGAASGSPVSVTSGTSYAGFDLSAAGVYTFKVKAVGTGTPGNGVYTDSDEATSTPNQVGGTAAITLAASEQWIGTLTVTGGGGSTNDIARSDGSLEVKVTGSDFASFVWIVDGTVVSGATSALITLDGSNYSLGGHSVTVYALDSDNVPWSPASPIRFTVTAQ